MHQPSLTHPGHEVSDELEPSVYEAMFQIFAHICRFWQNLENAETYRSRLFVFMNNRMKLRPEYQQHYQVAEQTMANLIETRGEEAAYDYLFTNPQANVPHLNTPLAITRQKVSNEFITFQINQGGFKAFGAKNSRGYIAGAYIPGAPLPYRGEEV